MEKFDYDKELKVAKVYVVKEAKDDAYAPNIYTLSPVTDQTGWETDGGYEGYGLPKELAEIYAKAINEYIEKHGPIVIKSKE